MPTQFRTNRTAGASYQHGLRDDAALQQIGLGWHRIAAQEIGDVNLLNIVHLDLTASQVHEAGDTAHMQWIAFKEIENFTATGASTRRYGKQDFLGASYVDHVLQLLGTINLQAGNHPVGNAGVIINERYGA
ncbi:hypothetical protein D9M71_615630 [compost metagenome]